jgi:hypothetical protein
MKKIPIRDMQMLGVEGHAAQHSTSASIATEFLLNPLHYMF